MTDREVSGNERKIVFEDDNYEKTRGVVWDKPAADLWLSFCPTFCHFIDCISLLLDNSSFNYLKRSNCLGMIFAQ